MTTWFPNKNVLFIRRRVSTGSYSKYLVLIVFKLQRTVKFTQHMTMNIHTVIICFVVNFNWSLWHFVELLRQESEQTRGACQLSHVNSMRRIMTKTRLNMMCSIYDIFCVIPTLHTEGGNWLPTTHTRIKHRDGLSIPQMTFTKVIIKTHWSLWDFNSILGR